MKVLSLGDSSTMSYRKTATGQHLPTTYLGAYVGPLQVTRHVSLFILNYFLKSKVSIKGDGQFYLVSSPLSSLQHPCTVVFHIKERA